MITPEEFLNQIEEWTKSNPEMHQAIVILSDEETRTRFIHYGGSSRDMAHMVNSLMMEDEEFGHDIFAAAAVYAFKRIPYEEVVRTLARLRRQMAPRSASLQRASQPLLCRGRMVLRLPPSLGLDLLQFGCL